MKIYDTYRTLFESYTKLISEELLDEDPSEKVKMAAVMGNPLIIQYIDSPSEELQMAAVKQKDTAYFYIKNPTDNVKRFVGTIDETIKKRYEIFLEDKQIKKGP